MKKIALVTSGFLPVPAVKGGGVEQLCESFIKENEKYSDYNIDLYTIYDEKLDNIKFKNTNIIYFKKIKIHTIIETILNFILKKLNICIFCDNYMNKVSKHICNKKKYDYIIIENNMFLFKKIHKDLKNKVNQKLIFHLHNDIGDFYKPINLSKYIANNSYAIITVSQYIKNRFLSLTKCYENKVFCVYNCVPDSLKVGSKKNKYADKHHKCTTFLYCGRFSREKGLIELIKAFNNLDSSESKLVVLGSPVYKKIFFWKFMNSYSKSVYRLSKKNKNIVLIGYVNNEEIYNYYEKADIVVIPTICEEAFGLVAVEAMRASKAIIASNSGGLIEIVNDKCSILVNKNNIVYELENSMRVLLNDRIRVEKMGNESYKHIKGKYIPDTFYYEIVEIMKEQGD